jgi:hypothetical protein
MEEDTNVIRVNPAENSKRLMFLIKEYLVTHEEVELISGTIGSPNAVRAAENLYRLGYINYESIKTDTILVNEKRKTKFSIKIRKTKNFKALYDENDEIRKRTQEIGE